MTTGAAKSFPSIASGMVGWDTVGSTDASVAATSSLAVNYAPSGAATIFAVDMAFFRSILAGATGQTVWLLGTLVLVAVIELSDLVAVRVAYLVVLSLVLLTAVDGLKVPSDKSSAVSTACSTFGPPGWHTQG